MSPSKAKLRELFPHAWRWIGIGKHIGCGLTDGEANALAAGLRGKFDVRNIRRWQVALFIDFALWPPFLREGVGRATA